MFKPKQQLKTEISFQGKPVVNDAHVRQAGKKIIAVTVDLSSKYCVVDGWSSDEYKIPSIIIGISEETLHLDDTKEGEFTVIQFPELQGWDIFSSEITRYTARICFTKA